MSRASARRVVVLGLDGLDPTLAEQWMAEGHLPNLSALAKSGSFTRLGTTYPAISPVAWSSFMTGVDPARHNIFDFLDRDVRTYKPRLSSSDIRPAPRTIRVGEWLIPVGRPIINNMRKSKAFWRILGEHGIPSNILRVPLTFPPEKFAGALLSAMCVPDLRGTQGSFTYYTTSHTTPCEADAAPEQTGGERRPITIEQGVIRTSLTGPDSPLRAEAKPLEIPFEISAIDPAKKTCVLTIGRKKYVLREREYSPWIKLDFKAGFGVAVRGIARFYVTSMAPDFKLYVTPINIDPGKPALPISWPRIYSIYLSKLLGEFATLGLAEDTWALNEGVIDEQAFLQQALDHHAERERMFFNALEKSRDGAVVCVFDGTDRLQHMFFRYLDSKHPANRGRDTVQFRDTILQMYQRCDEMIGRVQRQLGPRDQFMVISDHGFQSFRRGINLNAWLHQNGLLHLDPTKPAGGDWFANVDWDRTKAYALGLSGLFINQRGREAHGIVEPGAETEAVKQQIIEGLTGLHDSQADEASINDVFDPAKVHSVGPYGGNGPDLIIGYNRGYRASWEGAVGRVTEEVFADNTKCWSGDHCIDPRLVPGVLFSNWRMPDEQAQIQDLAPTILSMFGVGKPAHMTGRVLPVQAPAHMKGLLALLAAVFYACSASAGANAPGAHGDPRCRRDGSQAAPAVHAGRRRAEPLAARIDRRLHAAGNFEPAAESGRVVHVHHGHGSRQSRHLRLPASGSRNPDAVHVHDAHPGHVAHAADGSLAHSAEVAAHGVAPPGHRVLGAARKQRRAHAALSDSRELSARRNVRPGDLRNGDARSAGNVGDIHALHRCAGMEGRHRLRRHHRARLVA